VPLLFGPFLCLGECSLCLPNAPFHQSGVQCSVAGLQGLGKSHTTEVFILHHVP
jgi:hypothetical protein